MGRKHVVYTHSYGEVGAMRTLRVGMEDNNDIYFRIDDNLIGIAAISHVMTVENFDALVEAVHAHYAELPDDHL